AVKVPSRITLRVEHDLADPVADIDRDQIVQVLANLLHNAIDAMESDGALAVETRGNEHQVWFSVADTGMGIPEENLKKIFDPFFTTKPLGKGTGLGLAVTYGIIKMHSGDIQVQSNCNPADGQTGTTFTVTLPRRL
ncbi:MAG: ATP-binding protein, partial [Patescibacteria group bacterium]|nr:ATP-binding protein [Patescibacteria group bacterium]